jgi:hypothetical protein
VSPSSEPAGRVHYTMGRIGLRSWSSGSGPLLNTSTTTVLNPIVFVILSIKGHRITSEVFKITKLIFYHASLRAAIRSTTALTNSTHIVHSGGSPKIRSPSPTGVM